RERLCYGAQAFGLVPVVIRQKNMWHFAFANCFIVLDPTVPTSRQEHWRLISSIARYASTPSLQQFRCAHTDRPSDSAGHRRKLPDENALYIRLHPHSGTTPCENTCDVVLHDHPEA